MTTLLVALVIGATLASCAEEQGPADDPPDEPQAQPGWQALPESPLSPRTDAQAFWTGSSVLVVGGFDDVACPPTADCVERDPPLSDGAAYDPVTETWSELPNAPVPLGHVTGGVVDGTLYLLVQGAELAAAPTFLSYARGDDEWVELSAPRVLGSMNLAPAGDQLVAYHGSHEAGIEPDLIYDPATDQWIELPPDPLAPSFNRRMVWADDALVLLGSKLVANPGSERPAVILAARFDAEGRTWQPYPESEVLGGVWHWTGDRLVNPALGGADGGEVNNWGRVYPNGGILDPSTGDWSELPDAPDAQGRFSGFTAAGGGWAATEGWAFHVASGSWVELTRPAAGAADSGQAAVWAGDRLFVFGGSRITNERFVLVGAAWSWVPPRQ